MKPYIHAESSVKQFGGKTEDYIDIHEFMDSSKSVIADHRHRVFTHNSWFISAVLIRVFGHTIKNSNGKIVSVRDIGEQHVSEDFRGFIPTGQDWVERLQYSEWMENGKSKPASVDNADRMKQPPNQIPVPKTIPYWPPTDELFHPHKNPYKERLYD